jgi:hypothetical protein
MPDVMRMRRGRCRTRALVALLAPLLGACGDESPTEAGGPLLPGEIRTFEVILEPGRYLLADSAFAGYGVVADADYLVVANDFDGVVDAHALARFGIPRSISVVDSLGVQRTDSMAAYVRGEIVVVIDSATSTAGPVDLEALRTAEAWDPPSTTWQLRVDTGDVELPWTQPGGTVGASIDVQTWAGAVADSIVRFAVDSATIAAWRDTADHGRGALVRAVSSDVRLRVTDVYLEIEARPSVHLDTLVTVTIRPPDPTFVYDPPVPTVSPTPYVGGITAWRTFLLLRARLDTLRVPCPDQPACTLPMSDAAINYAALLLEPAASPPGFAVEDSLGIVARLALDVPGVPLVRSVLGGFAGQLPQQLPADRFTAGAATVELPITDYLRLAATDTADAAVPQRIVLLPGTQSGTFGYASFLAMPRLRLVLSVASELQLR